ncbi:mechanosensitive ion channel protein MscS [Arsenicibacter rosenii]|uniref:Mechanosensitive ion channel protein MscS n=2 Tax=Arsenicibacter rosenii TaxID=1750698 RepID=A0A1S2VP19_9BACT|nr:mechanosensitive ion channel protein MscS [Arsenicibacter rosenii]
MATRNGWLLMATTTIAGLLFCFIVSQVITFVLRRRPVALLTLLRIYVREAFYVFVPTLFFLVAANIQSSRFLRQHPLVDKFSEVLFIGASIWMILRLLKVGELLVIRHYDPAQDINISQRKFVTQLHFVRRLVSLVVVIVGISLILISFQGSRKLGLSVLTSAGIASVLIGFAAQKTLANLLAGIQIALTQQIRISDAVVVENEWGRIEEINLTNVVVRVWDRRRLILPITYFVENPFQNWTRNDSSIIGTVMLYLDYDVPVDKLREKARAIVEADPLWDQQVFAVQVTDTMPTCIQIRVLVSARDSPSAFDLRCNVREALIALLRDNWPQSLPQTRVQLTGQEGVSGGKAVFQQGPLRSR